MRTHAIVIAIVVGAAACGGSGGGKNAKSGKSAPKLADVKPAALVAFEKGMRKVRLGGPEATSEGEKQLLEAVKIDDTLWEGWHNLGVIASNDGEHDRAIDYFSRALRLNPTYTPTRLGRAEAQRRAGRPREARADYDAALKELAEDDPLRRDAAARLASLLRDAGSYDDAISVLRDALRVSGASSRIYTELGLIYIAQRRNDLAILVLAKAKELDEKDPAVYNAQALLALRLGKAQEAFVRFDHATDLDPKYLDARFNKASVLMDAGDYARAKIELDKLIAIKPDDLSAQVALGVAHRGLKDFKEAEKIWEKVVRKASRRDPARADALFNLIVVRLDFLENKAGAKQALEQYMQDAPGSHPKRQAAEEKRKELGL